MHHCPLTKDGRETGRERRPDSTARFRQMKEVQVAAVLCNSTISRFGTESTV